MMMRRFLKKTAFSVSFISLASLVNAANPGLDTQTYFFGERSSFAASNRTRPAPRRRALPRRRYSRQIISINLDPQENRNSAFRIAAREDRMADMKRFLKEGAGIDSQSDAGETALMYAARGCYPKIARHLLREGADVNLRDRQKQNALMYASMASCTPIVRLLLETPGLKLRLKDTFGKSALDYAIEGSVLEVGGPYSRIIRLIRDARSSRRTSVELNRNNIDA